MELVNFELHIPDNTKIPIVFKYATCDRDSDYSNSVNWHRNIEILVCVGGEGRVEIDSDVCCISAGDIVIVDSYRLHSVRSYSRLEYYIIIYDPDFCSDNDINTDEVIFKKSVRDNGAWELFQSILHESKQKDKYRNAGIRSAALSFMLYLVRNYTESEAASVKKSNDKVIENMRIAVGYIKSHFTESLTIDDICNEVGLSRYHFVREFKKIIGITPVSYINSLRIDKAKRMLLSGIHKISEVQEECGFENASYFTALFKRITGSTPTEFVKDNAQTQ